MQRRGGWPLQLLGGACALIGVVLAIGGAWLLAIGGSWYYLVAGLGLTISDVQLWRARRNGALWFAATFLLSLLWAAWESGTDYWRWVPRMGLMVFLALLLALLLPRLDRPFSRRLSRSLAAVLALVFVGAFALAFLPYGVTEADGTLAHAAGMAAALATPRTGAQPADAPADADWAAYGRDNAGTRYTPLRQIAPGNSSADYWSSSRTPQEDRYATSLVALDVTTGKPVWNFQTTHIDVWDYDLGSQPTLLDFPHDGTTVPAVLLPSKQGELYVLDRRTGKPLVGVEERAVPGGGVEPQRRAKTQPFSLYHSLRKRDLTERDMWGMTPIDQLVCRIQFRSASYKGIYTPPEADRHSIEYPGYNGGSDWGSVAVDPRRGVIVANYNDMPNYNLLVPRAKADKMGWAPRDQVRGDSGGAEGAGDPQAGTPYAINVNAGWRLPFTGLLCKQPPYGGIRAIDLASGKTLWDRPFGSARGNGPFGIHSGLPIEIGTPNNGGAVVSASGLIFIAAATDDLIRAIDLASGKTLWQAKLPAGGQATPMVYAVDGREYLIIVAAGHHFMETKRGDYVIAYALPPAG
ncbi:PQQ-binding-like beta-propeller repeat protein [uncultured Xanthomonas sp.]|uniref:outer membrane protein assembly factor BamB family protein n=1 Tax=uncultured Xanthomonas sp. TaxID=152831 RepID=UPI0025F797C6|nr:PQQ-binding-like beta-propeller repeat protein [uncultured Xanthomonas sp.]